MSRHLHVFRLEFEAAPLEPRELLSTTGTAEVSTQTAGSSGLPNLFHRNGINGLVLHASFVNRLNDRLANSATMASRVNTDLTTFASAYEALPANPPPGSNGPTLSTLIDQLSNEVTYAISTLEIQNNRPVPSLAKYASHAPRVGVALIAPLSGNALIPFARSVVEQLGATLATATPVTGPNGTPAYPAPTAAVNSAANAILNAIAESSIHPNLFTSPSDFYLSPDVTFTTSSSGAPASSSPGLFVRGPHGELLPGATLHRNFPA